MRGLGRLRRVWERLGVLPPAIILAYHRVADLAADPQLLAVSSRHFEEHLAVLRQGYHPLSLRALRQGLRQQRWRRCSVVVTFDDGYADNLHHAKPLLEAAAVPATVFVTAGMLDAPHEFWWDALEQVFLRAAPLPEELRLTLGGDERHWSLPAAVARQATAPDWHVILGDATPDARQAIYLELIERLRDLPHHARETLLDCVFAWAGLARTARPSHRALTQAELRCLAAGGPQDKPHAGLIEVGAHSLTHPVLSGQSAATQAYEITESKRQLEAVLEEPVTSLAYPFGGRAHYTAQTVAAVRTAGFTCACANVPGKVQFWADPYQLPRFLVRDWDGDTFARYLDEWFGT